MTTKRHFSRQQRTTVVYGIICFVLILVVLQLWLFTATMNAWLGGDGSVAAAELRNLATVGRAMVEAARRREESRGAHTREDFPDTSPAFAHRIVFV